MVAGDGRNIHKSLTTPITPIKPDDMKSGLITHAGHLLHGKVSSSKIAASGDPNRRAAIVLRAASTNNSPGGHLVVIAGVSGVGFYPGCPEDVTSIDVLKDAAAKGIEK